MDLLKNIPYNPGRPASAETFTGREKELETITRGYNSKMSFGLTGKPGMGKTSLLLAVKRELDRYGKSGAGVTVTPVTIYLEFNPVRYKSCADILEAIMTGFLEELSGQWQFETPSSRRGQVCAAVRRGKFREEFNRVLDWYYEKNKRPCRLVLLWDDLHRGEESPWLFETAAVIRPVVHLGDNMMVVLGGECPLEQEFRNDISPLRALISQSIELKEFSPAETAGFVRLAARQGWDLEPGCETHAHRLTDGYPYILSTYLMEALSGYGRISEAVLAEISDKPAIKERLQLFLKHPAAAAEKRVNLDVFVSYSSKNREIVDRIDRDFQEELGILLKRDERDLHYKESIYEFMKKVRSVDYILILLSSDFLKSKYCMYEILELLKDENYKDRVLPILVEDIDVSKMDRRLKYTKYWARELKRLNEMLERYGGKAEDMLPVQEELRELKLVKSIHEVINEFLNHLASIRLERWEDIQREKYLQIKEAIAKPR